MDIETPTATSKRPRFEIGIDTGILYNLLIATPVGGTVTYEQMTAAISRPVHGNTSNLQSAIRRAFAQDGMVFDNISRVGYRRLTDAEIVEASKTDRTSLRRRAKRAGRKLFAVSDYNALPPADKVTHATSASIFGAVASALKVSGIAAVENAVKAAGKEIPVAETLRLFGKG